MTTSSMKQRYLEDVQLGEEFEQEQHVTTEHVVAFINNSRMGGGGMGLDQDRFTDTAAARRVGLERALVPGPMSTAMITRLVTDWMGSLGRLVSLDVTFRRPVLHDDRLCCIALVTDTGADALDTAGPGLVSLDVSLENERGERPLQGTAVVELPRRG